jgi:hypothetical protein
MNDKYKKIIEDILAPEPADESIVKVVVSLKPGRLLSSRSGDDMYTLRRKSDWTHANEQVINIVRVASPRLGWTQTLVYLGHCKCPSCAGRRRREGPGATFHTILSTAGGTSQTFKITTRGLYGLMEQIDEP